jgi:hypothetical protein
MDITNDRYCRCTSNDACHVLRDLVVPPLNVSGVGMVGQVQFATGLSDAHVP